MGLFDSFKKSDSGLPKELENLLNMVLENGEISDDDMAVLRAKAEKFDISEGELNIIIKNRLLKSQPTAKEEKVKIPSSLLLRKGKRGAKENKAGILFILLYRKQMKNLTE